MTYVLVHERLNSLPNVIHINNVVPLGNHRFSCSILSLILLFEFLDPVRYTYIHKVVLVESLWCHHALQNPSWLSYIAWIMVRYVSIIYTC